MCINHGSTISLFHRLRSQTVSTKYLCVSGSNSSFKGSDGAPLMGLDQRSRANTPSFIARTASWGERICVGHTFIFTDPQIDPFVMYIVDVNKPAGGIESPPPPPVQPDYPSPPPNAIPFTGNGAQIPIYYNQTVVLQCLVSGVVSPVLIIRKVDHQTTVVGGGLQEGAKGIADHYCVPGEVCGDPVSQLHKIAFEVYDGNKAMPEPGTPGPTGAFLSCMGEKVNTYRPIDGRVWNSSIRTDSPPVIPTSPATPISQHGGEYFGNIDSAPASPSPTSADFLTNDGGRVKKQKRSTSSGGGISKKGTANNRRRPASAGSASSGRRGSSHDNVACSGALWQVDIGETSVWTIVGTGECRLKLMSHEFFYLSFLQTKFVITSTSPLFSSITRMPRKLALSLFLRYPLRPSLELSSTFHQIVLPKLPNPIVHPLALCCRNPIHMPRRCSPFTERTLTRAILSMSFSDRSLHLMLKFVAPRSSVVYHQNHKSPSDAL